MPDSSRPVWRIATVSVRSSSEEEPGWRNSTISWSLISLRAHWIMPTPMHSSARPEADAERHVGGAETEDLGRVVADLEDEVGDAEEDHEDGREPEQGGDLSLGALLEVLVDVGRTRLVRREAGVRDGFGLDRGDLALVDAHAVGFFLVERAGLAAIHTAKPTSTPMPTSQANRPSDTGPSEPSVNPPYAGVASFFFR